MKYFLEIATLCVSASALLVAIICLFFTVRQKQLAEKNNDLSGSIVIDEQDENLEKLLNENVGDIKCFVYDCQSVISNQGSDYEYVKEADRNICCGFARIRTIGVARKNQGLIDISCFNVDKESKIKEEMLFARCLCMSTNKYVTYSKNKKMSKSLAKEFLGIFNELYELLYSNIKNLIENYDNLNEQLFCKVIEIYEKVENI